MLFHESRSLRRQAQGGDGDDMGEQRTAIETVAMTLYGEARGTGLMDRLGVLAVIRERVLRPGWWGRDWQSVVQAPWQFTCWSQHDEAHRRNFEAMMQAEARDPATWRSLLLLADYAQHMTDRDISAMFEADGPDDFPTPYHDRSLPGAPAAWGQAREIRPRWQGSRFRWYVVEQGRPPRRAGR